MATVTQLTTQRATAGTRYAAAVAELHAALVDLAALDRVLANANTNPGAIPQPTFSDPPVCQGWQLSHPIYAPYSPNSWRDEIAVQAAVYFAGVTAS